MASTRFGLIVKAYNAITPTDYSVNFTNLQATIDNEITARQNLGTTVSGYGTLIGTLESEMDSAQADIITAQRAANNAVDLISANTLTDNQREQIVSTFISTNSPIISELQSDVTSLEGRVATVEGTLVDYEEEFVGIQDELQQTQSNFEAMEDAGQLRVGV
jgi:chromosome segregation ATPase